MLVEALGDQQDRLGTRARRLADLGDVLDALVGGSGETLEDVVVEIDDPFGDRCRLLGLDERRPLDDGQLERRDRHVDDQTQALAERVADGTDVADLRARRDGQEQPLVELVDPGLDRFDRRTQALFLLALDAGVGGVLVDDDRIVLRAQLVMEVFHAGDGDHQVDDGAFVDLVERVADLDVPAQLRLLVGDLCHDAVEASFDALGVADQLTEPVDVTIEPVHDQGLGLVVRLDVLAALGVAVVLLVEPLHRTSQFLGVLVHFGDLNAIPRHEQREELVRGLVDLGEGGNADFVELDGV